MTDSFKARTTLNVGAQQYDILSLAALKVAERRPSTLLPEDTAGESAAIRRRRQCDQERYRSAAEVGTEGVCRAMRSPSRRRASSCRISPAFLASSISPPCARPSSKLGGDPQKVNPLAPAELVIDHSVQVDEYGAANSLQHNNEIEFQRNGERYMFLRWGQTAFSNFKVVPPNTGIVHQVNIERLARVVFSDDAGAKKAAYPDTLVGTDSHTTMVNGLGVLGWGVGGIEAEAAMLGQPVTMLIPQVIGFKLTGALPPGTTATDLGVDGDGDVAQEGRGRQIRRVLRRWSQRAAACRSRHDRQHVAGIRLDLRDFPDR